MTSWRRHAIVSCISMLLLPLAFNACGQGFSANSSIKSQIFASLDSSQVTLSWAANRESAVNSSGGGYRIYFSTSSAVSTSSESIDVPFVSGAFAPTSVGLSGFTPGSYYARVQAYSAANSNGSALSSSIQFSVR